MSSYRDDINETLILQDASASRHHGLVDDSVFFGDKVRYALGMQVAGNAFALADAFTEHTLIGRQDGLLLGEAFQHVVRKRSNITETFKLKDAARWVALQQVADALILSDELTAAALTGAADGLRFSDVFVGQRRVIHNVTDGFRLGDMAARLVHDQVQETITLVEAHSDRLLAAQHIIESLLLGEDTQQDQSTGASVTETLRLHDEVQGLLRAANQVSDSFILWDDVLQTGDYGQAWTAGTQSWAMSRFAPFTFTSLAVIDDVLYGCNSQGVFALDGDAETMTAELRTGAMDMTGGVLGYPLGAHIEYELRGTATFDVTTTQAGTPATYSYPLNARPTADALTNARAVFGRGLRGRHFAYTLRLTGQQAYINDWSVLVAPSKRSI